MTKWISVKDALPERGDPVWVWGCAWGFPGRQVIGPAVIGYEDRWWDDEGDCITDVTHYMPYERPEPPEEEEVES